MKKNPINPINPNKSNTFKIKYVLVIALIVILAIFYFQATQITNLNTTTSVNSDFQAKGNAPRLPQRNFNLPEWLNVPLNAQQFNPPERLKVNLADSNLLVTCTSEHIQSDVILYQCSSRVYFNVNSPRLNPLGMNGQVEITNLQNGQIRTIPLPINAIRNGINQFTLSMPSIGFEQWNIRVCDRISCERAEQNGVITTRIIGE